MEQPKSLNDDYEDFVGSTFINSTISAAFIASVSVEVKAAFGRC
jgi:hypothetical protein